MARRIRFVVQGQVQGVGFRPFVFTLAEETALTGFVRNSPRGVVIEVQGGPAALEDFARDLEKRLPPLARITALRKEECEPLEGENSFVIAESRSGSSHAVLVSPDTATCPDCLADIADARNRRFHYPFTNCTNCGPRYSITAAIPYDRSSTSMACFPLCPDCRAEYAHPRDRRFHAQPNACPVCGPQVTLLKSGGGIACYGDAALRELAACLLAGEIAAIKGLGGFHLACDARNEKSVALLRMRKHRPHKPFAVMAADPDEARKFAGMDRETEALLLSPEHPIVICPLRGRALAPGISPDTDSVGLMLPYTPLHTVLFAHLRELARDARPLALVMTSGNPGGEPICLGNREALQKLGGMADVFLLHNRDILIRVDDSVLRPFAGQAPMYYRRARGYVPRPIRLARPENSGREKRDPPCILGAGADLKNTLCLGKGEDAFVSQHIGDMSNLETAAFHAEIRAHLAGLLMVRPEAVVRDLHPDFLSSRMAEEWAMENGVPLLTLQHHFAHAHAVLAEHAFAGKAVVLALDGTGLGSDGTLWGGEALYVDCGPDAINRHGQPLHERLATFAPMHLPGGEAAIREPWRIAQALLLRLGIVGGSEETEACQYRNSIDKQSMILPWLPEHADTAELLPAMLRRRVNCPVSTSAGRLFDAVSALLGLCTVTSYEGQAAILLEEAQAKEEEGEEAYPCPVRAGEDSLAYLDTHALFASLCADRAGGAAVPQIARRFHASLAAGLIRLAAGLASEKGASHIGLSGGCLQNMTLARSLVKGLEEKGFTVLTHQALPPNDACISLGQVAWARFLRLGKR